MSIRKPPGWRVWLSATWRKQLQSDKGIKKKELEKEWKSMDKRMRRLVSFFLYAVAVIRDNGERSWKGLRSRGGENCRLDMFPLPGGESAARDGLCRRHRHIL